MQFYCGRHLNRYITGNTNVDRGPWWMFILSTSPEQWIEWSNFVTTATKL